MSTRSRSVSEQVVQVLRVIPFDLVFVLGVLAVLATRMVVLSAVPQVVRFVVGVFVLFVIPGYVLVAILFPGTASSNSASRSGVRETIRMQRGITVRERLALSFGVSLVLVPIFALGIEAIELGTERVQFGTGGMDLGIGMVGLGYTESTILISTSLFVLCGALLAFVRRLRLPQDERFGIPIVRWGSDLRTYLVGGSPLDSGINVLLALSILVAFGGFTYAVAVPQPDSEFSSFALLTKSESGELVSADYPTNFTSGQGEQLVVNIENHHREQKQYTVVAKLQRVDQTGTEQVRILSQRELKRMQTTLAPGQNWTQPHTITPQTAGDNLRLVYYLYDGPAPANPNVTAADQHLHLWINVSATPTPALSSQSNSTQSNSTSR